MRIDIHSDERSFTVVLPTRLLFSKGVLKFGLKVGKCCCNTVPEIPPAALDVLCGEIRRIKKTNPAWELVNIQSAGGDKVRIIL